MRTPTAWNETEPAPPLTIGAAPLSDVVARTRARLAALEAPERLAAWAIVLAVVAVFAIGLRNEFVQWDDPVNLVDNVHFRGLGLANLTWMFTTTLMGHYIPLTWLSFALDYVIWGMQPAGYHFTNLALHAANAVLVFWIARRLLARALPDATRGALLGGAAVAALFFALHPLRAESVAWATERRDVLSGLLFLTSVLIFLRADEAAGGRRRRLLAASAVAFAAALLAKSIVMTLPLLLVVLDVYPLRRLPGDPRRWWSPDARRTLLEKTPFFILGLAGAALSYWTVASHDFLTPGAKYPLPSRLAMALYSVTFYISKTVLPMDLSALYELPSRVDPVAPEFLAAAAAAVSITVALALLAPRWPAATAAYAWYIIAIAPVGGLVHAGFQLAHDRYSYLSCVGWAMLLGAVPIWLLRARVAGRLSPALFASANVALACWLAALAALTWTQVQVWRSTETLWTHATFATPECSICHDNYGAMLLNRDPSDLGPVPIAMEHLTQALLIKPERYKPYAGLGLALIRLDRVAEAETPLRLAVSKFPEDLGVLNNLGLSLVRQGKFTEAEPFLRRAIVVKEGSVVAHANLGGALAGQGRTDEALREFFRATALDPFSAEAHIGLVLAYRDKGDLRASARHLKILTQLHPDAALNAVAQHGL
jgi:tetratricopeptide (TPR) repeat protein